MEVRQLYARRREPVIHGISALLASRHLPDARVGLSTVVDGDPDETIAAAVEAAHSGEKVVIDGEPVASVIVLPDFYERRGQRPAWTSPAVTGELVRAIRESTGDVLSKR